MKRVSERHAGKSADIIAAYRRGYPKESHFGIWAAIAAASQRQNAITQAEQFKKTIQCTGIILAKLDGTAKGGAIFAIKQKLGLPVKFVGVGEQIDDLENFDPDAFVNALFEKE